MKCKDCGKEAKKIIKGDCSLCYQIKYRAINKDYINERDRLVKKGKKITRRIRFPEFIRDKRQEVFTYKSLQGKPAGQFQTAVEMILSGQGLIAGGRL